MESISSQIKAKPVSRNTLHSSPKLWRHLVFIKMGKSLELVRPIRVGKGSTGRVGHFGWMSVKLVVLWRSLAQILGGICRVKSWIFHFRENFCIGISPEWHLAEPSLAELQIMINDGILLNDKFYHINIQKDLVSLTFMVVWCHLSSFRGHRRSTKVNFSMEIGDMWAPTHWLIYPW